MKHPKKHRNSSQPQNQRKQGELGQPREPQGDVKHFDKHGGKLDHDGRSAKSQPQGDAQGQHADSRTRYAHRETAADHERMHREVERELRGDSSRQRGG
ncbi:MAG TPA: hypothetical protein VN634_21745 [Candidatus Limnocylindrales bacterium]|nr:hypothetical protein [Candidatus Limnocylindrales bacterium]